MAQCINFLQYKCIDFSSLPETHIKKSVMVPLQSRCWEEGIATYPGLTRGSLAESLSFRPTGRPCLKKQKEKLIFLTKRMKKILLPFALIMVPAPLPSSLCPRIQAALACACAGHVLPPQDPDLHQGFCKDLHSSG